MRKNVLRPLRHRLFQRVIVVQTSQNRLCPNAATTRNLVALRGWFRKRFKRKWNSRPQTLVWTAVIVVCDPLVKGPLQVLLGKRNDEVKALSPYCAHNSLAITIAFGARTGVLSTRTPMVSTAWSRAFE